MKIVFHNSLNFFKKRNDINNDNEIVKMLIISSNKAIKNFFIKEISANSTETGIKVKVKSGDDEIEVKYKIIENYEATSQTDFEEFLEKVAGLTKEQATSSHSAITSLNKDKNMKKIIQHGTRANVRITVFASVDDENAYTLYAIGFHEDLSTHTTKSYKLNLYFQIDGEYKKDKVISL